MTLAAFLQSLDDPDPPAGLAVPLLALWHAEKGDWDTAHRLVMSDDSPEAAWVHACLHRQEGDLGNAGYWYPRAGRPVADGPSRRSAGRSPRRWRATDSPIRANCR